MTVLKGRSEWLEERTKGIGGSDAAAIIGLNPWKDNVQLWEEKTGRKEPKDLSNNPRVIYGQKAEEYLRELFRLDFPEYEVFYQENNSWTNDKYPFARASLDGWLKDKDGRLGVLEIKTADILSSLSKEKWRGGVPDSYYVQVLHCMMVIDAEFAVLKASLRRTYGDDVRMDIRHYFVERSEVQDQIDWLAKEEEDFWNMVKTKSRPNLRLPEI